MASFETRRGAVPLHTLAQIIGDLFGIPISEETVYSMVKRFDDIISTTVEEIKRRLLHGELCHFDGTGMRLASNLVWLMMLCTDKLTWIGESLKGKSVAAMRKLEVDKFHGIDMYDCLATYWQVNNFSDYAVYCEHIMRELRGIQKQIHEYYQLNKYW